MRRSVLYIAAMLMTGSLMMWEAPLRSYAEPTEPTETSAVIEAEESQEDTEEAAEASAAESFMAAASQVLTVPTEEDALAESGPDLEIQAEKAAKEAEETAAAQAEAEAAAAASVRQHVVNYALQFVGGPYRAGGNDPRTGVDCSGFVKYVMEHAAGISMNRSSGTQASQGRAISAAQMQPGDLLFYGSGSGINHVAMYIGDGQIVHASTYRTGIKVSNWNYRSPVKIVSVL